MLNHVGLPVSDFKRGKRFCEEALSPLGYELLMEPGVWAVGFGRRDKPDSRIAPGDPGHAVHGAFTTADRATVDALYEGAIAAGATTTVPGFAPSSIRAATAPSFSVPRATTSKLYATDQSRQLGDPYDGARPRVVSPHRRRDQR